MLYFTPGNATVSHGFTKPGSEIHTAISVALAGSATYHDLSSLANVSRKSPNIMFAMPGRQKDLASVTLHKLRALKWRHGAIIETDVPKDHQTE